MGSASTIYSELKAIRSTAPINGRTTEVLRPVEPIRRLFVSALADGDWEILADLPASRELMLWCALAAYQPDSIVWIPKSGDRPSWNRPGFEPCDLVLCHHAMQLRASSWKTARDYAKHDGHVQTLSIKTPDDSYFPPELYRQRRRPPGEDVADFSLHSNTVFIAGSEILFRFLASQCASQLTCTKLGDHVHLFNYARHEPREGARDDITIGYCPPEYWL